MQALVTLNDPQFVESARHLAQSALQKTKDANAVLDFMARRVLLRALRAEEIPILTASHDVLLTHYTQSPDDAKSLLTFGESKADPALPPAQLAAWTMVANQILNLDETLNK